MTSLRGLENLFLPFETMTRGDPTAPMSVFTKSSTLPEPGNPP